MNVSVVAVAAQWLAARTGAAITQPARMASYSVDPDIAQKLAEELHNTDDPLVLMQCMFCESAWPNRDVVNRKLLDEKICYEIGGIEGAIARHADAMLVDIPDTMDHAVRNVLTALVTPERTRAVVKLQELYAAGGKGAELVVKKLIKGRLLTIRENEDAVCLVHDALITHWTRLKQSLDQMSIDDGFRVRLQAVCQTWANNNRDENLLWRGEQALEAKLFKERYKYYGELPRAYRDFTEATIALLEQENRKKRRRLFGVIGVLGAATVGLAIGVYTVGESRLAARHEATAARIAEAKSKESEADAREAKKQALINLDQAEANARRAEKISAQLEESNKNLITALTNAEQARTEAQQSESKAKKNATTARLAEVKTMQTVEILQHLLSEERERSKRLEGQLGNGSFDSSLPWLSGTQE